MFSCCCTEVYIYFHIAGQFLFVPIEAVTDWLRTIKSHNILLINKTYLSFLGRTLIGCCNVKPHNYIVIATKTCKNIVEKTSAFDSPLNISHFLVSDSKITLLCEMFSFIDTVFLCWKYLGNTKVKHTWWTSSWPVCCVLFENEIRPVNITQLEVSFHSFYGCLSLSLFYTRFLVFHVHSICWYRKLLCRREKEHL